MKKIYLFVLTLLFSLTGYSQSIMWENVSPYANTFNNLHLTDDHYLIGAGNFDTLFAFSNRYFKYDLDGNLIWQTTGRNVLTGPTPLVSLANGYMLGVGHSNFGQGQRDVFVQQMNSGGDTLSAGTFVFHTQDTTDYATSLLKLDGDTFVVSGTARGQDGIPAYYLRKFDLSGNTIWYSQYAKEYNTSGPNVMRNKNQEFVILGSNTYPSQVPIYHPYLVKVSAAGDNLLEKKVVVIDSSKCEGIRVAPNNISETSNGDYIFAGTIDDCSNGIERAFVARVDSSFNLIWGYEHMPQENDRYYPAKVAELEDGSILLLASNSPAEASGFFLIRLSAIGQFISQDTLKSSACASGKVLPRDWIFMPDSSIVVCGMCGDTPEGISYMGRWGNLDLPTIKQDTIDTTTVSVSPFLSQQPKVKLFPNPAREQVRIELSGNKSGAILQLYSVTGRRALERRISGATEDILLEGLPQGLYLYRVLVNDHVLNGKLVLE